MEESKPFLKILSDHKCLTGYDLLYNVRGVNELVGWKIPYPLAVSIYDVIEAVHKQGVHLSKRHIQEQIRISGNFERFMNSRRQKKSVNLSELQVVSRPSSEEIEFLKEKIKEKLEVDVLELPVQRLSLPTADVLFKAAFLVCDPVVENSSGGGLQSYILFLESLVSLQLAGEIDVLKETVRKRIDHARIVANSYIRELDDAGIKSAEDMTVRLQGLTAIISPVLMEICVCTPLRKMAKC